MAVTSPPNKPMPPSGTLAHLRSGASARVVSLDQACSHDRAKLMAMGILPGSRVRLLQRFPTFVVSVGYGQVALDKETARLVSIGADE